MPMIQNAENLEFSDSPAEAMLLMVPDIRVENQEGRKTFLSGLEESFKQLVKGETDQDFLLYNIQVYFQVLSPGEKYILLAEDLLPGDLSTWNDKIAALRDEGGVLAVPFIVRPVELSKKK